MPEREIHPSSERPTPEKRRPGRKARAIALKYDHGMPAPVLYAKAEGRFADTLIRRGSDAGLPVVRDPVVVEALFPLDAGTLIPESWYAAVAAVFVAIARMDRE